MMIMNGKKWMNIVNILAEAFLTNQYGSLFHLLSSCRRLFNDQQTTSHPALNDFQRDIAFGLDAVGGRVG